MRNRSFQKTPLKRGADGIVDAITAEDIGDFPDSNLAESLQRITGVSVDRERGEGARVTVRGFGPDFNLVLLNGRQMPTASGLGRSFDFGNLASEGISPVEVYKSGQAQVPTGGIGATMSIRTTRPLERRGRAFTATASTLTDLSTEDGSTATPEVSALVSDTFADDRVGIALSAVHQDRVRAAYNWRDDFFAGTGQVNVGAGPPTYVAAYKQLDVSASYWITDALQVFVDAINLTDETTHVYGRDRLQTLAAGQAGPRFSVGFRCKL